MMLVGRAFEESTIYRAAHAFEQHADWRRLEAAGPPFVKRGEKATLRIAPEISLPAPGCGYNYSSSGKDE
jgi:hypothetical protein